MAPNEIYVEMKDKGSFAIKNQNKRPRFDEFYLFLITKQQKKSVK